MARKFDVTPYFKPDDPFVAEYADKMEEVIDYYDMKYRIATLVRPKSILEIGVRAGYSAAAFLAACDGEAKFLGLDLDAELRLYGGCYGYSDWALTSLRQHFPKADIEILQCNTQTQPLNLTGTWDLVHVDGDHSEEGCFKDLCSVEPFARWILVDDYSFCLPVFLAVTRWLQGKKYEHISLRSMRGEKLIKLSVPRLIAHDKNDPDKKIELNHAPDISNQ